MADLFRRISCHFHCSCAGVGWKCVYPVNVDFDGAWDGNPSWIQLNMFSCQSEQYGNEVGNGAWVVSWKVTSQGARLTSASVGLVPVVCFSHPLLTLTLHLVTLKHLMEKIIYVRASFPHHKYISFSQNRCKYLKQQRIVMKNSSIFSWDGLRDISVDTYKT